MTENKFGEKIGEVQGVKGDGEEFSFKLRFQEVKHIRRLVLNNNFFKKRYYPNDYPEKDLNFIIYRKFSKFGRLRSELHARSKKGKIKDMEKVCVFKDCEESDSLTIDHIIRANIKTDKTNSVENLQLLCPKHHLLKELGALKLHKEQELKMVIKRIEDIELRDTTDCLGYQVLSKNKFTVDEEATHKQPKEINNG